jgi:hypothetical protein
MWCLPSYIADTFLKKITDGTITPEKMIDMTSAQRRALFTEFMGEENARQANTLLESKLILKNQQMGMVTWAKKIAGITPEAERSLVARVNKMTEVLTPENEDAFLEDLAAHALGTTVTMEEAGNITSLSQEVTAKKEAMEAGPRRKELGKPTKTELDYGRAMVAFDNYINSVKLTAEKLTVSDKLSEYLENPFRILGDALKIVASTSRELRTTLDNSYIGKQGRNLFFKGMTGDFKAGKAWMDVFVKSHKIIWETFKGNGAMIMDEVKAEILSDPEYDLIRKAKVATSVIEEETPTDWYKNIPYLGRPFEASHNAFTASAHLLRYKTAKYYFEKARQVGTDLTDKTELEAIGGLVNALTGRGEIGKAPGLVNNVFFSPQLLKADFNTVTAHVFDKKASSFVRKEAAKNLMRIIVAQAIILAIADLIDDDSVQWDPRSPDFGKIKAGNTRFDISGGMGVMVRLAARLAPLIFYQNAYIRNANGKLEKINTGQYGKRTGLDIFEDFVENKSAPLMSVFLAHLAGKYPYTNEKPTVVGDIRELFVPLPLEAAKELKDDENSANFLVSMLAEAEGVFTQTYKGKSKITIQPLD